MSYKDFTTEKLCEFCQGEFSTKNSRDRYCPECMARMPDIKRVMGTKSPSLATPEERRRILERTGVGRTTRQGPTFGLQYYIDKGLPLPEAYER